MRDTLQEAEGKRRQLEALRKLTDDTLLTAFAYGHYDPNVDRGDLLVKALIDTRLATRLAEGTKAIAEISEASGAEVKRLVNSSERLERLTDTLKTLTVWLTVLTIFAAVVPIGIEVWKAYHEPQPAPVLMHPEPWK